MLAVRAMISSILVSIWTLGFWALAMKILSLVLADLIRARLWVLGPSAMCRQTFLLSTSASLVLTDTFFRSFFRVFVFIGVSSVKKRAVCTENQDDSKHVD